MQNEHISGMSSYFLIPITGKQHRSMYFFYLAWNFLGIVAPTATYLTNIDYTSYFHISPRLVQGMRFWPKNAETGDVAY